MTELTEPSIWKPGAEIRAALASAHVPLGWHHLEAINKNVDMLAARRKEQEYFQSSPDYGHLAHKMGAEYLAKLLSQVRSFALSVNFAKISILHKLFADVFPFIYPAFRGCDQSQNSKYYIYAQQDC